MCVAVMSFSPDDASAAHQFDLEVKDMNID